MRIIKKQCNLKLDNFYIFIFLLLSNNNLLAYLDCIKINQLGYLPDKQKIFFVSTSTLNSLEFRVRNINNVEVYSGILYYLGYDISSGDNLYEGDFSDLTSQGTYYIEIPNLGKSYIFRISEDVYLELFIKSMRAFLFQRCGYDLNEPELRYKMCHKEDGKLFLSGKPLKVNAIGGWHDAGDYGKYIVNLGVSVGTLIHIYELCKDKFFDRQFFLPNGESYNGVPDILDEIKYGISWIFAMQNPQTGGVYHKLTAKNFEGLSTQPDADFSDRYIIDLSRGTTYSTESSAATGNFIGILAGAYRVFKDYDTNFAIKCISAALSAWEFLEKNPDIVPQGGFKNPQDVQTGEYGDSNDTDERLWAASELFAAIGDKKYSDYFISKYSTPNAPISWQNLKNLAIYTYYFAENAESSMKSKIEQDLKTYADSLIDRILTNKYNVILRNTEYYWGSNSVLLNYTIDLIYAYEILKDNKYREFALEQLSYILGRNATSYSYVTGLGYKFPQNIHHRPSIAYGKTVSGFLVAGPNSRGNDPVLADFIKTHNLAPAKCYIDDINAYSCNEIAINWNAPLVFVSAYFLPKDLEFITMPSLQMYLFSPRDDQEVRGNINVQFNIYSSTGIKKVEILLDGKVENVFYNYCSNCIIDTTKYEDGKYNLQIKVENTVGDYIEKSINIIVANNKYTKLNKKSLLTLNKDSINDYIDFTNNSEINVEEVKVYNLYGKLIKNIKKPPFIWNGTDSFNNEISCGTYIYIIKKDDNTSLKGIIYLIK
ncbi:MAG: glycoside hydrolase family 9 protein [Endomicrobia bacterium]|nr:glycoside hydrolase family 9 protein [Endomicrobiia bacterium]